MAPDESHDGIATEMEIGGQTFNFQIVLQTINKRLAKLSGRDHKIGHSYFIGGEEWNWQTYLDIFTQKIVPLLQEYFYGDWAKMCLVLGAGFVNIEAKEDKKDFFASLPKTSGIGMEDVLEELQEQAVWVLGVSKDTSENDFAAALKLLLPKAATAKNESES